MNFGTATIRLAAVTLLGALVFGTPLFQPSFIWPREGDAARSKRSSHNTEISSQRYEMDNLTTQNIDMMERPEGTLKYARECKNYTVYETEIWIIISTFKPNPITCTRGFITENDEVRMELLCPSFYFRFGCNYESLIIQAETTLWEICKEKELPIITGREMIITYERQLHGLHGGYLCFLRGVKNLQSGPLTSIDSETPSTAAPAAEANSTAAPAEEEESPVPDGEFRQCLRCGLSSTIREREEVMTKIVGGSEANKGDFPWMVAIHLREKDSRLTGHFACGGSLITENVVLTAAHCLEFKNPLIEVTLGAHKLSDRSDPQRQTVGASRYLIHELYNSVEVTNDIALIYLDTTITFTDYIRPICLPTKNQTDLDGLMATAAGWGKLSFTDGVSADDLMHVELPITPHEACKNIWQLSGWVIQDSQMCAFAPNKDTCSGDSGGPLFIKIDGRWVVVGIVSFGVECADEIYPGVYTRISSFTPWIVKNLPQGYCQ